MKLALSHIVLLQDNDGNESEDPERRNRIVDVPIR